MTVHKIFRKTNISYPLIRTRTCAYQGVRNVSFSENCNDVIDLRSDFDALNHNFHLRKIHLLNFLKLCYNLVQLKTVRQNL